MKKILQAFDGAAEKKPVQGANDMKKFLSIVKESANPYTPAKESVITSFEEGSVGGDANAFLLAADTIQDEVMAQVNKIKINADEASLRDMMDKFNAFMTAYHNVGKGILQPDMFNDSMGENVEEARPYGDYFDDSGISARPGHDEGEPVYDPRYDRIGAGAPRKSSYQAPQDKPKMVGMFFYNVQPGQENEAAALGIKQTKSGKWAKTKYSTSGHTFGMQKDQADKKFGIGKWWAPKNESVEQDVTEGSAHGYNVVRWYEKSGGDQIKLTRWLKKEAGLPKDADVYFDDADLVYGDKTIVPDALVNPKLKFNDLLTAVVNASGSGKVKQDMGGYYRENAKQSVAEMDKSQTPPGRDGSNGDSDAGKKEYNAKVVKPGDVAKKATAILDKAMKKTHAKENLSFKDYVNLEEAKKGLE